MPIALAQEPEAVSIDDIGTNLSRSAEVPDHRRFKFLEDFTAARTRWRQTIGLDYAVTFHTIAAAAFPDETSTGAGGDLTLQGTWKPSHRWVDNPTELRFRLRDRQAFGDTAPSGMAREIGALWGITDGFTDGGFEIPDFYLRHHFPRSRIELRYGQMTVDSQFDAHKLRSSKQAFLNQAFSSNPAVAFPRFGAGLTLKKEFKNGIDVTLGATNVQGTQQGDQVDFNIGSADFFKAIQLGYNFKTCGNRASRVQMMLWHSDGVETSDTSGGHGLSLTAERELHGGDLRAFARLAYADGAATPVQTLASGGLAWTVNENDLIGCAAGAGRGSGPDHELQAVFEAFYRWQPREGIRITPDFQFLAGQGYNGSPGLRFVIGLRAGIDF